MAGAKVYLDIYMLETNPNNGTTAISRLCKDQVGFDLSHFRYNPTVTKFDIFWYYKREKCIYTHVSYDGDEVCAAKASCESIQKYSLLNRCFRDYTATFNDAEGNPSIPESVDTLIIVPGHIEFSTTAGQTSYYG